MVFRMLLTVLVLVTTVFGQDRYLAHFSPEHRNLVVIYDVAPHLEAILKYPPLRKALIGRTEGPVRKINGRPDPDDPQQALIALQAYKPFIPREIVIGVTDESLAGLDAMVRSVIFGGLMSAANEIGEEQDRQKYEKLFAESIARVALPSTTIYLRMRDVYGARTVRYLIRGQMDVPQIKIVEETQDGFVAEVLIGALLEEEIIADELASKGAQDADELAKHLASLKIVFEVRQVEDGLRLVVASSRADEPWGMNVADLPQAFRGGESTIMAGRWDLTRLKRDVQAWVQLWQEARDTPTGKCAAERLMADDEEGLFDALVQNYRSLMDSGDKGVMRLTRSNELLFAMDETGAPKAESLRDMPIAKMIPADAGVWHLTTRLNLGELVAQQVLQAEDKLEQRRVRDQIRGSDGFETLAQGYYGHLFEFRRVLLREAPEVFGPGAGMILQPRGSVSNVDISWEGDDGMRTFAGAELPIARFALIGRPKSREAVNALMQSLHASLLEGVASARGLDEPIEPATREIKLGGNVSAVGFVSSAFPMEYTGDLQPHYFVKDGVFVFSTSTFLSAEILAGGPRQEMQDVKGTLVTAGGMSMSVPRRFFEILTAVAKATGDGEAAKSLARIELRLAPAMRLVDDAKWYVSEDANGRHTRFAWGLSGE